MKRLILILLILSGCSRTFDYNVSSEYDTVRDKILLYMSGNCDKWSIKSQYGENIIIHHENKSGYLSVDRIKDTKSISRIIVFCNDKKLKEIDLLNTTNRITTAILFNKIDVSNLIEQELNLFKIESFYDEFKKIALNDSRYLINSLNILHLFPIHKEFELIFEGYLRFKNQEFFDYIVNNLDRFIALRDIERFINYGLNYEKQENYKKLMNRLLSYPIKRIFSIVQPFLVLRNDIRNDVYEFLIKNQHNEFSESFFEDIEKELSQGTRNDYILDSIKFIFEKLDDENKKRIFRKIIQKSVYFDLVKDFYNKINLDRELLDALISNFSSFDEEVRIKIFYTSEPFFKNDLEFYLKMIDYIPSKREEILAKIAYDFRDKRLSKYYLEYAKKRPIHEFVFIYLNNIEEDDRKRFLHEIFKEPIIQKKVLDLMHQYEIDLFKRVAINIFMEDKHPLNEYAIDKIKETKILPASALIERFNQNPYKEKILLALIQMGEENDDFIIDILAKSAYSYPEALKVFLEKANNEKVINLWKLLDKKDKKGLIDVLAGIENRKKPVLCDEIIDIIKSEKDKDLKFSALWAYVYSCQELYLKNFEIIKITGDKDLYKELISGFRDLGNLRPDLKVAIKLKIQELLENEKDEELKHELLLVLEGLYNQN